MAMLEIRNVQKTFRTYAKPGLFHRPGARKVASELPVLRGVDLTVEKGDVVAILGPSGSGKTTLLRCLNFLETADAGQLVFDGESFDLAHASRADIARLRKKTAFVFQNYNLFRNKTALQNVTEGLIVARKLPKEQADEIGMKMLAKVGLADRADYYPRQLSAIVDAVLLGEGITAYGPLQRNRYDDPDVEHYDYDPQKAKEVLEAAGCMMGEDGYYYRDGEKIGFVLSVGAGDQARLDIAQAAAQQLKEVGIDCTVEVPVEVDWGGQMAYLIGWGSPFDADDHTYKVFGTGKGANYSSYSDPLVDQYLTEARESDDPAVRAEAYDKFQEELAENPAFTFICYIDANYVAKDTIQGISADTVMGHHGVGIFWNVCEWTID